MENCIYTNSHYCGVNSLSFHEKRKPSGTNLALYIWHINLCIGDRSFGEEASLALIVSLGYTFFKLMKMKKYRCNFGPWTAPIFFLLMPQKVYHVQSGK